MAAQAERQAAQLLVFAAADLAHVDLFARVNVRMWEEIALANGSPWPEKMAQAAREWDASRQGR